MTNKKNNLSSPSDHLHTDDLHHNQQGDSPADSPADSQNDLRALRQLLLGGPLETVLNPPLSPEAIARVLPEALAQARFQQDRLTDSAVPTIESAIQASVQKDSNVLSEALFPVIGPATRKSIAAAIGNLLQSLNQALEYSLSPQSFRWRLEARRTGKSFAEIVLLRTLVYQVEQVFLIHRESGLVLQHVVAERVIAQDPDLVSAMLTALQDFVRDSFSVDSGESLNTLMLGDFTLWLEEGPHAILACVIRGTAPQEMRDILRTTQEKIHLLFKSNLQSFDGDQSVLEGTRPYLEDCFQSQFKERLRKNKKTKLSFSKTQKSLAWLLVGCLGLGMGLWSFMSGRSHQRWEAYVAQVDQQPGLVVISHGSARKRLFQEHYFLTGLRDPLAADPLALLEATHINPQRVSMRWDPYFSLLPELMSQRIEDLLNPPETVAVTFDEYRGVHLSGRAPAQWIHSAKQLGTQIYGITGWDDGQLIAIEQEILARLQSQIESRSFVFDRGSATLRTLYTPTLRDQAADIKALSQAASQLGQTAHVLIHGNSDLHTNTFPNPWLGQSRANTLKQSLLKYGTGAAFLEAAGTEKTTGGLRLRGQNQASQITFQVDLRD